MPSAKDGWFGRTAVRLLVIIGLGLGLTGIAVAQDEKKAAPADAPKAAPKDAPKDAPKAGDAKPADAPATSESFLGYMFRASPVFFVLMTLISVVLVSLTVQAFMQLRTPNYLPPALVRGLDGHLADKKYREAYDLVKSDKSLLGRSLAAGVERLQQGPEKGAEGMIATIEDGRMELEHQIAPIAWIGSIGPLLGLLGTVLGMIQAFQQIGQGGQPRPAQLAEAIGLALVTTLEGLIVAIPAVLFFALFRNWIGRLIFDVETVGEAYLTKFAAALRK
jgi:biopolymer transport protein ExbB